MLNFFDKTRRTSMAPVSRLGRHQLGEATTNQWRTCHRATLLLCILSTLLATPAESKTDLNGGVWSDLTIGFTSTQGAHRTEAPQMASLTSTPAFFHASPAGGSSNRMRIPIPNHPAISHYINRYKDEDQKTFREALDRSWPYMPVMEEIFRSEGVPEELIYIALVESCFRGRASYRGAKGYWQLLGSTARSLGLRVDSWVDERVDPVKSTHAAARYLRLLHEEFESWPLALAAYNAGSNVVSRAKQRHGSDNFWALYDRKAFPGRTRAYVAKVLGAIQVARNLEEHGFSQPQYVQFFNFESIQVGRPLKLDEIAKWLQVPADDLRDLNPSLRKGCVPPGSEFTLRVPSGAHDLFHLAYRDYIRR
jgi:membrane-bound lytic murein transglycosylase D